MSSTRSNRTDKIAQSLYLICVVFFAITVARNHINIISHELPLDYQEASMLEITSTIADGANPFSLESQPVHISLYPVLYNIVVAPISKILGNTLWLHRLVSAIFIIATCALCYILCRRASATRTDSLAAATILYAGLLYYSTPIASPNSLGLFLFLSATCIPWLFRFSSRSLAVSIALGILAFYTKQYFLMSLGYVALFLFLADSKKRGIYFGFLSLLTLLLSMTLVHYTSPYYLDNTFFAVASAGKYVTSNNAAVRQFSAYFTIYYPIFAILVLAAYTKYRAAAEIRAHQGSKPSSNKLINWLDWNKPLFSKNTGFIGLCCLCSIGINAFVLARNPGNYLTYLFQLISPFLLIGTFGYVSGITKRRWLISALACLAMYNSYSILPNDFSVNEKNWGKVRSEIAAANNIYASTLVLREVMDKEGPIYHNGHTPYFLWAKDKPAFLVKSIHEETIPQIWQRHRERINTELKNQSIDLVLLDNWMQLPQPDEDSDIDLQKTLQTYYEQTDLLGLRLMDRRGGGRFNLKIYKPKDKMRSPAGLLDSAETE
ncbi:MAG: hypothetical protein GY922_06920 [Proteobacteria bacterium]|nr:hypothetical protein [Pseudomonadota bacterium]